MKKNQRAPPFSGVQHLHRQFHVGVSKHSRFGVKQGAFFFDAGRGRRHQCQELGQIHRLQQAVAIVDLQDPDMTPQIPNLKETKQFRNKIPRTEKCLSNPHLDCPETYTPQ